MKTVIEMAREAGIRDCTCNGALGCLERFASLVRADAIADEREHIAKFVEDVYVRQFKNPWREDLAAAIRARRTHEDRMDLYRRDAVFDDT